MLHIWVHSCEGKHVKVSISANIHCLYIPATFVHEARCSMRSDEAKITTRVRLKKKKKVDFMGFC